MVSAMWRLLAGCAALAATLAVPQASARNGSAYCAVSQGHEMSYENCGFATFEACLEELKGMRGYCRPNQYYVAPSAPEPVPPDGRRARARR
jgi:hypothetical protein